MLLIDGNNFLRSPMPPALAGLDESGLCRLLVVSGLCAHERGAVVVCDGGPRRPPSSPAPPDSAPDAGTDPELVFAGKGRSADALIIERIGRDSAPRRLIVVSDDHEIQRAARKRGASVWGCGELVHELLSALASRRKPGSAAAAKFSGTLGDEEVRRWAKEFGLE
jgi:hypothetical protein